MKKEELFAVIVTCVDNKDTKKVSSNLVLHGSFDEALSYARSDAKYYKHLASLYQERVGDNKHHAEIKLYGKYINKTYRISNLAKTGPCGSKLLEGHLNTYDTCDFYDGGILL